MELARVIITGLAASLMLLVSLSAEAQEGLYKNRFQTVVIERVSAASYAVEMSTANASGCGGTLRGSGQRRGNILIVEARGGYAAETCIITIQFGKGLISVREEANCTYFHGAACDFSGRLTKR